MAHLAPSETAFLASSPDSSKRTVVWISRNGGAAGALGTLRDDVGEELNLFVNDNLLQSRLPLARLVQWRGRFLLLLLLLLVPSATAPEMLTLRVLDRK